MGNTCRIGESDAPPILDDHNCAVPKGGKQIRVLLVDSDFTDSEVEEAVKRAMKGETKLKKTSNSSALESSNSSANSTVKSKGEKEEQLIAKGAPKKMKKVMMLMKGKKSKLGKIKSRRASAKKKSSVTLSSVQSSADSSADNNSSSESVKVPVLLSVKVKSEQSVPKERQPVDSSFFSTPLRMPSDLPSVHCSTLAKEMSSTEDASPPLKSADKVVKKTLALLQSKSDNLSDEGSSTNSSTDA